MNTHNKFLIQPSHNVPNAGFQPVRLGIPEPETMTNDICFVCIGSYEFIPINSIILREALLNSADFLRQSLGLNITKVTRETTKVVDPEPKVKSTPVKVKSTEDK